MPNLLTPDAGKIESGKPITVCLASEKFYPAFAGGAIRFLRYLPGLRARGINVQIFCGTPTTLKARVVGAEATWKSRRNGEMLPVEMLNDVPVHRVRLPDSKSPRRRGLFSRALFEFCRQPKHRPDVVQLLSLRFYGLRGVLGIRRLGVPMVFSGSMVSELPSNPVKRALLRQFLRIPLQLVDSVVVSSSVMRQYFCGLGITVPIEVIANGVDLVRFRPAERPAERQIVRRALGIGPKELMMLFVGSVKPRKGLDLLLEVWVRVAKEHPNAHLVIVGPRRDRVDPANRGFHERLEALCVGSGAPERVHFAGIVGNVEDYMRAADIFVFPSQREGMPNVVLEAMASGLPVVMTPFVGLPAEFGEPGRQYLLAESRADELGLIVERVLSQKALRDEMGQSARRWVEEHMDVEMTLDEYAGLYRGLANGFKQNGGGDIA